MSHHHKQIPIHKLLFPFSLLLDELLSAIVSGEIRCTDREREALLRFKQGLKDDHGHLSSWRSEDDNKECCEWNGVVCSNATGTVTAINFNGFMIRGNLSSDILELRHLNYLDLTSNNFGGSIPYFLGSITSLEFLSLTNNHFSGTVPYQLGNLTKLRVLTLNYNSLVHRIPKSFTNLTQLQFFYINLNSMSEPLSDLVGKLSCSALESIDVSFNDFTGEIPAELMSCHKLRELLLHHNPLSGSVPVSLGNLSTLEYLDISFNSLQGKISESHLTKLNKLYGMDIAFNSLALDFSPSWRPPFLLQKLTAASCRIGPSFPAWLQTQTSIFNLDVSNAGISDKVPSWLWSLSSSMTYFNLSQNKISGTIPDLSSNFFGIIDVSSNNFSGPLPLLHPNVSLAQFSKNMFSGSISFICGVLSSQLVLLDLSKNQLSGTLPNCWSNISGIRILDLNDNAFYGEIPNDISALSSLQTLHLRGNKFSGLLPSSLRKCRDLQLIDIGGNKLTGNIPPWLGEAFTNLTYLSLHKNKFYGGIPSQICRLTHIQMLDISGNDISGQIPPCFNNFTSLVERDGPVTQSIYLFIDFRRSYFDHVSVQWKRQQSEYRKALGFLKLIDLSNNRLVGNIPKEFFGLRGLISLNLSRNGLTGRLDSDIGEMEMLESLDLSNNQLSGEIPIGLAKLHYLGVLDLANNSFTGQIPLGTQLQGFNASSYSGNDGLCGPPLALCRDNSINGGGENIKEESGFMSLSSLQGFCIALGLGFIVGFWGVVGSLVVKRPWRIAYFGFVDDAGDWLYVTTTMFLAKFK